MTLLNVLCWPISSFGAQVRDVGSSWPSCFVNVFCFGLVLKKALIQKNVYYFQIVLWLQLFNSLLSLIIQGIRKTHMQWLNVISSTLVKSFTWNLKIVLIIICISLTVAFYWSLIQMAYIHLCPIHNSWKCHRVYTDLLMCKHLSVDGCLQFSWAGYKFVGYHQISE